MTDQFQATSGSPVGVTVSGEAAMMLSEFWPKTMEEIRKLKHDNFKQQELPLARIKKIMKLDEDVKMISQEAPVLFAKAAEIFISELSLRAWIHTEDNKRRTLQRNDIAMAITKYDQFDFLIDIVPRDELKPSKRPEDSSRNASMLPDQIQYYLQLAQQQAAQQQQQQQQQQQTTTQSVQQVQPAAQQTIQIPGGQIIQQQPFQVQTQTATIPAASNTVTAAQQPQIIQIQAPQIQQTVSQIQTAPQVIQTQAVTPQAPQVQIQQQAQQPQQTQVYQQVITASGEVQNVPIQLTPQQLQAIQMQLQGKQSNQPIIIQSSQQPAVQTVQTATQSNQSQFGTQSVFQIQQLPGGQQVYIQNQGETDQADVSQDGT